MANFKSSSAYHDVWQSSQVVNDYGPYAALYEPAFAYAKCAFQTLDAVVLERSEDPQQFDAIRFVHQYCKTVNAHFPDPDKDALTDCIVEHFRQLFDDPHLVVRKTAEYPTEPDIVGYCRTAHCRCPESAQDPTNPQAAGIRCSCHPFYLLLEGCVEGDPAAQCGFSFKQMIVSEIVSQSNWV